EGLISVDRGRTGPNTITVSTNCPRTRPAGSSGTTTKEGVQNGQAVCAVRECRGRSFRLSLGLCCRNPHDYRLAGYRLRYLAHADKRHYVPHGVLIQTSQNRDSTALQAKLDELIRASSAQNLFVGPCPPTKSRRYAIRYMSTSSAAGRLLR